MSEQKAEIIKKFRISDKDTGSAFVQIAVFTDRINNLTKHLQSFRKDFASRLGLLKIIGKRKRLMSYLKSRDESKYRNLVKMLNIRG